MNVSTKLFTKDYLFDLTKLEKLASEYHPKYINAKPFPHTVIDNFLPEEALNTVLEEFRESSRLIGLILTATCRKNLVRKLRNKWDRLQGF